MALISSEMLTSSEANFSMMRAGLLDFGMVMQPSS
jgi:hypothetical protein